MTLEWRYPSRIRPAARWPKVIRGTWAATFHLERGDFPKHPTGAFLFALFIDGEQVAYRWTTAAERNIDGRGAQRVTIEVDSTRWSDGPHQVVAYGYPADPEPAAPVRWHARHESRVTFRNGAVPMLLLPDAQQLVVRDASPVTVAACVLCCDGSTRPACELALATTLPERVAIDGATLRLLTDGWATVNVRDVETGVTADIRVGRYPATLAALPHLGRDWSVKHAVDDASRWVIAPFYQSIRDAMGDPNLARALAEAGLLTFWDSAGWNIGTRTLAQYQADFETRTKGYWEFLAATNADVYLVFDEIGRTRPEARASLDNPDAAAAYAWSIAQWRTRTRGYGIRVIDEVVYPYRVDPLPSDHRWDHFGPPAVVITHLDAQLYTSDRDWSALPVQEAPAHPGLSDMRPRLYVRTGAYAGKYCRIARGGRGGALTLATDELSRRDGFDARSMRLAPGDLVVVAGWWADGSIPLPDDTFARFSAMLRAGGVPFGYPVGAHAGGAAVGRWSRVGTVADVYSHLVPGFDVSPSPAGPTLPQGRLGRDLDWDPAQETVDPRLPMMAFVSGAGPQYTKRSNRRVADFDPAVDLAQTGTGRARYTGMHLALALIGGACGASVYFFDDVERRRERTMETFPRSVLPEGAQTGFHPFAKGTAGEIFRAIAAFRRLVDTLGPRVFAPLGVAPALGPGLRASRRGDLLLVANTREVPVTTVPVALTQPVTRWRLAGESLRSERLGPGGVRLTLEPGELTALVGVQAGL